MSIKSKNTLVGENIADHLLNQICGGTIYGPPAPPAPERPPSGPLGPTPEPGDKNYFRFLHVKGRF